MIDCDYSDCTKTLDIEEMVNVEGYMICKDCLEKMENSTGYCSISCQLGYGCDDSC